MAELNYQHAQEDQPEPSLQGGASGYLSPPRTELDPALFEGSKLAPGSFNLRPNVMPIVLNPLMIFLNDIGLQEPAKWIKAWIAGSAITYQWSADRGNGDLDILLGIDHPMFDAHNPGFKWMGDEDLANELNEGLRVGLWPKTANTKINGKTFEVTYFYNPGTGMDIRNIHPYAAYDLLKDQWVVEPPSLPTAGPHFPHSWFEKAAEDTRYTADLVDKYKSYAELQAVHGPGTPGYINAGSMLNLVTAQAHALLTGIHHGRTLAFQGGGEGYTDWHNFRWQRAKATGAVKALSELVGVRERAEEDRDTSLYGSPVKSADELVRRAMLYRRNG